MATDNQLRANRANAKRSSGPRSEQGRRNVALNAIKHGLSMSVLNALGLPDSPNHQALQSIADLISPEFSGPEAARDVAMNILTYERNETAQRELYVACCLEQGLPSEAALQKDFLQRYPEFALMKAALHAALLFTTRPERRWINKGMKIMQAMQLEFVKYNQREQELLQKRWVTSQRYLKRAANQLSKAIKLGTRKSA